MTEPLPKEIPSDTLLEMLPGSRITLSAPAPVVATPAGLPIPPFQWQVLGAQTLYSAPDETKPRMIRRMINGQLGLEPRATTPGQVVTVIECRGWAWWFVYRGAFEIWLQPI